MPSLRDFVAALQAGWFPALAALVGCAIVLAGDYYEWPYLSRNPDWLLTAAVLVGVFSFSVLAANIAYLPVAVWRWTMRRSNRRKFRERVQREVFSAPPEEISILAYLVTTGRKAFAAEWHDRRLAPLVAKGMVIRLPGTHSMLEWPFVVHDDVWELLLDNQQQLHVPDADQIPDPFNWKRY